LWLINTAADDDDDDDDAYMSTKTYYFTTIKPSQTFTTLTCDPTRHKLLT